MSEQGMLQKFLDGGHTRLTRLGPDVRVTRVLIAAGTIVNERD
ncbi:hypothetical protein AB6813_14435 [bacterium RCC_150]